MLQIDAKNWMIVKDISNGVGFYLRCGYTKCTEKSRFGFNIV